MSSSWYKSGNIIHTWSLLYIIKSMSLNFGDISGVELREIPQEESDLEDEVFFKNGEEDLDKTNDNILLHAVIWRGLPGYFYFDVIHRGLPGFGSNLFFW